MATVILDPEALASWTVPAARLREWAATARAGEELVYARGTRLAPKCSTAAAARALAENRYVVLLQRKRGMATDYVVRRLRPAKVSIGRSNKPFRPVLDGDMSRLLRVLRGLARSGHVVPENRVLAKQASLPGADQASYVLKKLVAANVVKSRVVDAASGARVVTIVATGAETAVPGVRA